MVITQAILDELSAQAKANPRLRQNLDLRNTPADSSQRMLNAQEPGTVMPIHRHHGSSETVVILRGRIQWIFYGDNGVETERVTLDANGDLRCLNVERNRWHSLVCLESGSVLLECKDGKYRALEGGGGEGEGKTRRMKSENSWVLGKEVGIFAITSLRSKTTKGY